MCEKMHLALSRESENWADGVECAARIRAHFQQSNRVCPLCARIWRCVLQFGLQSKSRKPQTNTISALNWMCVDSVKFWPTKCDRWTFDGRVCARSSIAWIHNDHGCARRTLIQSFERSELKCKNLRNCNVKTSIRIWLFMDELERGGEKQLNLSRDFFHWFSSLFVSNFCSLLLLVRTVVAACAISPR